jgi:hypothetical protein
MTNVMRNLDAQPPLLSSDSDRGQKMLLSDLYQGRRDHEARGSPERKLKLPTRAQGKGEKLVIGGEAMPPMPPVSMRQARARLKLLGLKATSDILESFKTGKAPLLADSRRATPVLASPDTPIQTPEMLVSTPPQPWEELVDTPTETVKRAKPGAVLRRGKGDYENGFFSARKGGRQVSSGLSAKWR